jgi:hypothetical protein
MLADVSRKKLIWLIVSAFTVGVVSSLGARLQPCKKPVMSKPKKMY